jgi:hypothetical protein
MKKDYHYFMSKADTYKLRKQTWLLGLAGAAISLNSLIAYFYTNCRNLVLLILCICFAIWVPTRVTDSFRENRGTLAAISMWIGAAFITILFAMGYSFPVLYIIFAAEILLSLLFVFIIKK